MITHWRAVSLIALFLSVLALPALDTVFRFDRAPQPNENRRIAEWPKAPDNLKDLRSWCADVERYYNDHFGFRKQLIRWNNRWRKSLFRDLKGVDVIQGQDGWLYFTPGHVLDHLLGQRRFDNATLEALRREFEARADWLAQKGITYVVFVAPDKEAIYPEFLPEWLIPQIHRPGKLDQFLDYMRQHSKVVIVDVRPALLAAKTRHEVYLRTDSHWNSLGAYVAAQEVLKSVASLRPDFPPIHPVEAMRLDRVEAGPGDAARMLGRSDARDLDWKLTAPDGSPLPVPKPDTSISAREWPGSAGPEVTLNPAARHRLVMFHDSFGRPMEPHLGLYFQRAVFVFQYLWSYRDAPLSWSPDVVEREKPDVVIDEIVERALLDLTADRIGGLLPPAAGR